MKKLYVFFSLSLFTTTYAFAQNTTATKTKVYIECSRQWLCDFDFLRTELPMVDFVRDRFIGDLHIQVNTEFSSNGTEQNTVIFKGQKAYTAKNDTLTYYNSAVATDDDKRKAMVQYIKLGVVNYILHTDAAKNLVITYNKPKSETDSATTKPVKDPWNYWILSLNASGFFDGDANYQNQNRNSNISADRETNKYKTNLSINYSYNKSNFVVSPTESITRVIPRTRAFARHIIKVNEHWGYGIFADYRNDVFSNLTTRAALVPKVEYDFYPYKKFNNQRVVVSYGIGPQLNTYNDTTLFFKTQETLLEQQANIISSFTKPWGNVNVGAFYSSYLADLSKYSLSFSGSVNWNIFKGFRFGLGGNYDITRNLIQLPKQGASRDQVLTQQRQLNTAYSYFVGVGFSYQFGSKYNNFINPAFKGLNWGLNF